LINVEKCDKFLKSAGRIILSIPVEDSVGGAQDGKALDEDEIIENIFIYGCML
jgi:hypothetical protein